MKSQVGQMKIKFLTLNCPSSLTLKPCQLCPYEEISSLVKALLCESQGKISILHTWQKKEENKILLGQRVATQTSVLLLNVQDSSLIVCKPDALHGFKFWADVILFI